MSPPNQGMHPTAGWIPRFGENILHIRKGGRVETQKEVVGQGELF